MANLEGHQAAAAKGSNVQQNRSNRSAVLVQNKTMKKHIVRPFIAGTYASHQN